MANPFVFWTRGYKDGKELQATPDGQAQLFDTLARKGYLQVMIDPPTKQLLGQAATSDIMASSPDALRLPGKDYIARPYSAEGASSSSLDQASAVLHDIARSVLRAFVSAPDCLGDAARLDALLDQSPAGTSLLHANKYKTAEEDAGAPHCGSHRWHKDRGLVTVGWSASPGLEVNIGDQTVSIAHGDGSMVTISLGMTLEAALLETVHVTEHRSVYTGTPRTSLAFKLRLPCDTVLDASLLRLSNSARSRIQPTTVQRVYEQLSLSIHYSQADTRAHEQPAPPPPLPPLPGSPARSDVSGASRKRGRGEPAAASDSVRLKVEPDSGPIKVEPDSAQIKTERDSVQMKTEPDSMQPMPESDSVQKPAAGPLPQAGSGLPAGAAEPSSQAGLAGIEAIVPPQVSAAAGAQPQPPPQPEPPLLPRYDPLTGTFLPPIAQLFPAVCRYGMDLVFRDQEGHEIEMRTTNIRQMGTVFTRYYELRAWRPHTAKFFFLGRELKDHHTPDSRMIWDRDVIHVVVQPAGE